MLPQIVLALVLASVTVLVHAAGTACVVMPLAGIWTRRDPEGRTLIAANLFARLMIGLLSLHLLEMAMWAGVFTVAGVLPDFETSLYFSLTSYTRVGCAVMRIFQCSVWISTIKTSWTHSA